MTVEEQENYKITAESLKKGKVGVPYSDKIAFGKPADVEDADIEIKSNSRYVEYGGLSLSADGTFAGTPESGEYYNWGKTVDITFEYYCKGYLLDSKTLTLTVEGYTQISYVYGKTLYYNGTEQTAYEDAEGYTVTGNKATDVGTYTATFKLNPGYAWGYGVSYDVSDWTATWKIEKVHREAPTGLSAVSTSGEGVSDGKITGVTEEMEYQEASSSTWTAVTGTEITGLAAGTYYVRYAESKNYYASVNTEVKVTNPLIAIPVPTPKPNVVYNGGVQWGFEEQSGTGYYLSEGYSAINAGTYTAIAKLDSGYKWADGTLEDKEIEWTIEQAETSAGMFEFAPPAGSIVYDGEVKTASVTVRSYYESEGFTVTVKYQKDGAFVSDPTDAGTYTVYIDTSGTPNYKAGKDVTDSSWTFTIERAEQAAPEAATFTATAPTAEGESDGKITGVTEEMEYKEASSSAWTAVTGTEITGLAAGNYEVRFKQTDNYNASPSVSITIPDGGAATYTSAHTV